MLLWTPGCHIRTKTYLSTPSPVYFMDTKLIEWNNGATQVDKSRENSDNHRYLDSREDYMSKDQLSRYSLNSVLST